MALLEVRDMTHEFGGLRAVNQYNLAIEPGQIRGLIGPNGAGKTTIFNLITGVYTPTKGEIEFQGQNIIGLFPHQIASMGLGRTFQDIKLWRHMSVLDHVKMARYSKLSYGFLGSVLGGSRRQKEEAEATETAMKLLKMLNVEDMADQLVINLPYGVQRRVEMARALAIEPKVLFLDEPTVGMTPDELDQIIGIIKKIHRELGLGIFLIEHRLKFVMELCEQIQCLVFGEVMAEGGPEEIQNNPKVIEAYLGEESVSDVAFS